MNKPNLYEMSWQNLQNLERKYTLNEKANCISMIFIVICSLSLIIKVSNEKASQSGKWLRRYTINLLGRLSQVLLAMFKNL